MFSNTGANDCNNVTTLTLPIGPPGSPQTITVLGDNTGATGPDCAVTGQVPVWWEALHLTECATVSIDFCGTTPANEPSYLQLQTQCPPTGNNNCGFRILRDVGGRGAPGCPDNNVWMTFFSLPAGTYYFPIRSDNVQGPYELHISAEQCVGACCHFDEGTCIDGESAGTCSGPNEAFNSGISCCNAECLPPGEPYARRGMELLSHLFVSQFPGPSGAANDVWGYVSPRGREYAIIGLDATTGFVDVTDPFNPVIVADIQDVGSFWSDMKVYPEHAYNVNEDGGGMQIFDLRKIDKGIVTLAGSFTQSGLQTVHSLTLNEDSGYAYLNGSNLSGGRLIAVSLANPTSPGIAGTWLGGPYVHDSQVVTYTSGPYAGLEIAFCYGGGDGFYIVNVTNKSNMQTMGHLTYPTIGYCHQGWLTDDRTHVLMGDEGDEFDGSVPAATTYVINVEDLTNPFMVTSYNDGKCHVDHDLIVDGNLVYKASYTRGMVVDDITNINVPQEVAYFDTHPEGTYFDFAGTWGSFAGFPSGIALASDIERGLFVLNYDCNRNLIDDTDDIALLTSQDCNINGLPDECEYDCNANAVPDDCDLSMGMLPDVNGNNVLDECECTWTAPPQPEPLAVVKNRYLSFVPGNAGEQVAIRVRLTNLDRFGGFNGQVRWVGPAQTHPDVSTGSSFVAAPLQCTPHYADWGNISVLHVFGPEVVPGSSYEVQSIHQICAGGTADETNFTVALPIDTAKWGDLQAPFGGASQPNFGDVSALVDSFRGLPTALRKARSQLQPNTPNPAGAISFQDISLDVDAFSTFVYPMVGPANCP